MSTQDTDTSRFKAMYLGSEPMGELLEGENGSDAIQVPLRRIILRTNFSGREAELKVTSTSLTFEYIKHQSKDTDSLINLPIELLAYCGALRQLPHDKVVSREFETLDKAPMDEEDEKTTNSNGGRRYMPPLFVTIFRSIESENMLFCHAFVLSRDDDAMELVKLVMEVYYSLVKMSEDAENEASADFNNDDSVTNVSMKKSNSSIKFNTDNMNNNETIDQSSANSYLKQLLSAYNKISLESGGQGKDSDGKSVVSARDLMNDNLDLNQYTIVRGGGDNAQDQADGEVEVINQDSNPIVIRKQNNEEIVYKQNVYIRWLQPPTPPPPAPIISNLKFFFHFKVF
jgi:hypothetical protein